MKGPKNFDRCLVHSIGTRRGRVSSARPRTTCDHSWPSSMGASALAPSCTERRAGARTSLRGHVERRRPDLRRRLRPTDRAGATRRPRLGRSAGRCGAPSRWAATRRYHQVRRAALGPRTEYAARRCLPIGRAQPHSRQMGAILAPWAATTRPVLSGHPATDNASGPARSMVDPGNDPRVVSP
jgi:hypothetical protein